MKFQGQFRLRTLDAAAYADLRLKRADWLRDPNPVNVLAAVEELKQGAIRADTGWCQNIVTDLGRRVMSTIYGLSGAHLMFIHASTAASSARRTALQNTYSDAGTVAQARACDSFSANQTTLLQTRLTEFARPTVARAVNTVGLTTTSYSSSAKAILDILCYSKLTSTVTQGTDEVADLQHRLTWSLD